VLGAGGLIVWMADEAGQSLAPAITHGYPSSLVARLGRLNTGDHNATAAAWRARSAQVVDGALAVPLVTSLGCTGVLAIEFRDGGEHRADTQALARIIAAQLAATISPAATESRKAAGG
jgi:GAF domain-containing protein